MKNIILNFVYTILLIWYPLYYSIVEFINSIRYYKKDRPVKVLDKINKKLDK